MATINGVEVIGDKSAHDFGLLDNQDKTEIDNGIERNREATEDNHEDIVLHRTDTDVHVTPEWKNSLVSKETLGLYWTAAQTADIINEISIAGGAKLVKVATLPETGLEQTIYLVPKTDPQAGDVFDEYVWVDGKFEFIGTTKVDLSNYATKAELNAKQDALSNQQIQNIADVTNKANDADVVHKSGNESISGVKTFSNDIAGSGALLLRSNSGMAKIYIRDIDAPNYPSSVNLFSKIGDNPECGVFLNGNAFHPNLSGEINLGATGRNWKNVYTNAINGITPGALSLPSISNTGANAWIAIDTTDWVKFPTTSAAQKYTPPADGWLNVRVDNATLLGLASTGGGNYMHQMVRSETPNSLALLLPVIKNIEIAISVNGNENLTYSRVTFYPCQGNV